MSSELSVRSHPEPQPVSPVAGRGEWWLLDRLAGLVAVLSGAAVFLFIGRGSWYVDDFVNLGIAQESTFDRFYINRPIFGHPQQGTRILNWLLYRISPMNYALAATLVCVGIALTTWMIYRILRLSFRPSPWLVVFTALAGFSGLWVPATQWWAGGSEITGCVVAEVLVIHGLLRAYLGPRRILWALLTALWLVIGLAFYERTLLGAVFAACYLLAVACRRLSFAELFRVIRRAAAGYLALLTVALAYLGYYASHRFVHAQPGYTRGELVHFLWISWSNALVPGLFGGSLRTGPSMALSYAYPQLWWVLLCQLALLALIGYGLRSLGPRALVGWLIFIPLFLAGAYAIATARLHVHGPSLGREDRYVADLTPLIVLTAALTVLVPRLPGPAPAADGEAQPVSPQPAGRTGTAYGRRNVIAAGVAVVVLLAVFVTSTVPVSRRWTGARSVGYVHNLQSDLRTKQASGAYSVYTTFAPAWVNSPTFGQYSLTTRIGQLLTGKAVDADNLSKPMFVVNSAGHLVPARLDALASVPDLCATTDEPRVTGRLSRTLPKGSWTVQLDYRVPAPTTLRFAVDTGSTVQEATGMFRGFPVSGSGRLTFLLRLQTVAAFRLDAGRPGVCVSNVQIGRPVQAG